MSLSQTLYAPPPLVTADVPTADKGVVEWYLGTRYQESGESKEWLAPFAELVYGISSRQELTLELTYLLDGGENGIGDAVIGTKYLFLRETETLPGIAGSFEIKLPTASQSRGLGSGELDYNLRLRTQKTWHWFTAIFNLGYTFIGEPETGGVRQDRHNVWFLGFAQEYQVHSKTRLLSEIFWETSDEPGGANTFAGQVGVKHYLRENLNIHAAVGSSLRDGNRGGPDLRVYAGFKYEFSP